MIAIIYVFAGILTGLLATMFGFGGGFIVVPLLFWFLSLQHISAEIIMHVAIGTSLALMIINMLYASWLHYLNQNMDISLLKLMLPAVILGAIAGSIIASLISSYILKIFFITLASIVLLNTIRYDFFHTIKEGPPQKPSKIILYLISLITGVVASMLGIGGGVIIVPFFRYYNYPIPKASAIANGLAIPSSLTASLVLSVASYNLPNLPPYSTGYIYWPAIFGLFSGSIIGSKIGIYFSKKIPAWLYGKIYAFLLLIVIFSMLMH